MIHQLDFMYFFRKCVSRFMNIFFVLMSLCAALPFIFIVYYVWDKGFAYLNLDFFTKLPQPPGEAGGGMANAVLGSLILTGLAGLVGAPWGLSLGLYLSEYKNTKTAQILRLVIDVLLSAPSIVVGIFIYGILVAGFGFSAYAGATALLIIMLPVTARGSEEILRLIPGHIREAGLALGIPKWKMTVFILLPGAFSMLITMIMLALARIAGETAPLLFTALGSEVHISSLSEPISSLPVQIYEYSKSGFEELEGLAWAGALVLMALVFFINLITRLGFFLIKKYK